MVRLTGYGHLGADDLVVGIQVLQSDLLPLTSVCRTQAQSVLERSMRCLLPTGHHCIRLLRLVIARVGVYRTLLLTIKEVPACSVDIADAVGSTL